MKNSKKGKCQRFIKRKGSKKTDNKSKHNNKENNSSDEKENISLKKKK